MPTVLAKTAIDMSPLALFLQADIVVKAVMLLLIALSRRPKRSTRRPACSSPA
jgi:hypothetical protein